MSLYVIYILVDNVISSLGIYIYIYSKAPDYRADSHMRILIYIYDVIMVLRIPPYF